MTNLVYMAKPTYGGWISFTVHLCYILKCNIYKITKRSENKKREYGYGIQYTNKNINDLVKLDNLLITAIDKNYYKYLDYFPDNTMIVIHDPTEIKINVSKELLKHLHRFNIITIRQTVKDYLKDKFNLESRFIPHPFYPYPKTINKNNNNYNIVSISRIDYDKNIDIILKANKLLPDKNKIKIYGKLNELYVFRKLKELDTMKKEDNNSVYCGRFEKSFDGLTNILNNFKFVIDLSSIKNDGGGTQYTFLECIHHNCILILNSKWVNQNSIFIHNVNCIVVSNENDIVNFINNMDKYNLEEILKQSKKILDVHLKFEIVL